MNILLIGNGGREHALAWKISQSPLCSKLFIAPGNAGTAEHGKNVDLDISDFEELHDFITDQEIEMLVVGPEKPLVDGIADYFKEELPALMVVGPSKQAAALEGSKAYAKEFMRENRIPTALYVEVTAKTVDAGIHHILNQPGPYVLKADGLAGGKGVLIIQDRDEAIKELEAMLGGKFGRASHTVVIEEFLDGIEFSVFVLTDGQYYMVLPEAKDYKRIGEGDTGLNTGGMGAVSPVPFINFEMMQKVKSRIILPTLKGLDERNIDYVGFIFFGLISVKGEPFVIEYNCRLGDPETEAILPRIQNDIVEIFLALFDDSLYEIPLELDKRTAATVIMVSGGYPGNYGIHKPIRIKTPEESIIFHSGTKRGPEGQLLTNGGRVLAITSMGENHHAAVAASIQVAESIEYDQKYYRRDIGFDL